MYRIYKTIGCESQVKIIEKKVDKGLFISAEIIPEYGYELRVTNRSYIEFAAGEFYGEALDIFIRNNVEYCYFGIAEIENSGYKTEFLEMIDILDCEN